MVTAIEGATPQTWKVLLAAAVRIFDDLEDKGFGAPTSFSAAARCSCCGWRIV